MTPAWQDNHVVDPRRLWEIYDGETYWIAAPTEAEAIALWRERPDAGKRAPLRVRDVTSRAATIEIVGDEGVGPSRSARQWMDALPQLVVVIGSTAW